MTWPFSGGPSISGSPLSLVHSAPKLVGVTGFEPATSSSRTKRATKLRHTPILAVSPAWLTRHLPPDFRQRPLFYRTLTGCPQSYVPPRVYMSRFFRIDRSGMMPDFCPDRFSTLGLLMPLKHRSKIAEILATTNGATSPIQVALLQRQLVAHYSFDHSHIRGSLQAKAYGQQLPSHWLACHLLAQRLRQVGSVR